MRVRDLSIRARLLLTMTAASFLMLVVGGIAYLGSTAISGRLDDAVERQIPALEALAELDEGQMGSEVGLQAALLRRNSDEVQRRGRAQLAEKLQQMEAAARLLDGSERSPAMDRHWQAWRAAFQAWRAHAERAVQILEQRARAIQAGKPPKDPEIVALEDASWAAYREGEDDFDVAEGELEAAKDELLKVVAEAGAAGEAAAARVLIVTGLAVLLGVAVLFALGWRLAGRVGASLAAVTAEAERLRTAAAAGTLDVRGDEARIDPEFRPIVRGMNETMAACARPIAVTAEAVTRISKGDLPPPIGEAWRGDFGRIQTGLDTCVATLTRLVQDADGLAAAAVAGRLGERADAGRHQGAFRRLVEGMNQTVATLVGHLDAMPAPAFLIDREMRLQYVNAAALAVLNKRPADVLGTTCSSQFGADDCGTDRCACGRAMRDGRTAAAQTVVHAPGGDLEVAYSGVPVRDGSGAIIGAFEVISDQTQIQRAMRASRKVTEYQDAATKRLVAALERMAKGDLDLDLTVEPGDADTAASRAQFEAIARAVAASKDAVQALARDAEGLAGAAVAGRLAARAELDRHQGEFRRIVEGVNRTLDAVLAPLQEASGVLQELAHRDLRARVRGHYQGDHARMTDALNGTAAALNEALEQVAEAVRQVSGAASQIAASSQAVASGASEQAASLQETSASLDAISAMTRQTAESADQASALAQAARGAATEGAGAVTQMQAAMGRIRTSAEGTSQIIKDVSDIAFQTNLLALNAAVEAARAGEAGRGFAVVAEEVRSLALRAKEAAGKTEELIRQSVRETGEGELTAAQAAGKLQEILTGVGKVTDVVQEIAQAAKAQAAGIEQLHGAVGRMDKVTQQNAASAEQSSSAASQLSGQSEELAAMVGAFALERRVS